MFDGSSLTRDQGQGHRLALATDRSSSFPRDSPLLVIALTLQVNGDVTHTIHRTLEERCLGQSPFLMCGW